MLAPDSRALLLDALRPPSGHSLDRAVATTFTLDLETALMVPLAFAGFRFDEQPDPVEVMEALRGMGERFDIFCQAGAIYAGSWPSDLVALLENVIREVRRPRPGHIFHPKIWVLRFLDRSREPSYRLLVLSRNLTGDRSWDTILWLDGRPEERPIAINEPLARFVAALPGLSATQLPPGRRAALAALAEELRRVHWDRPAGVRELRFLDHQAVAVLREGVAQVAQRRLRDTTVAGRAQHARVSGDHPELGQAVHIHMVEPARVEHSS